MQPIEQPQCSDHDAEHHVLQAAATDEAIEGAARLFRALGDVQRLKLLVLLAQRESCVTELAQAQGETLATLSQRIRILRNEDLVTRRRDGKHINYALADQHVVELIANALAHAQETPRARRNDARS